MGALFSTAKQESVQNDQEWKTFPVPQYTWNQKDTSKVPLTVCYSYIGTGYHGLQQNMEMRTIEHDLFYALIACGLMEPNAYRNLSKIRWNEASRTDTGVHACAQVVTFFANFAPFWKVKQVAQMINAHLPKGSTIRVWSAITVGRVFQAQRFAEYRKYNYLLPLHILGTDDLDWVKKDILAKFVGEHNFHNYTKRVSADNPSAVRTITDFDVSEPFDLNGVKYVLFTIRGNSFMMNQIRKTLAMVLACSHKIVPPETIEQTFTMEKWAIPKLPGEGLMLDRVEYPGFRANSQRCENFVSPKKDVEFEANRGDIANWKTNVLFPHIAELVKREQTFEQWLESVLFVYKPMTAVEMLQLREKLGLPND